MKIKLVKAFLAIFLLFLFFTRSVSAQTLDDLKNKYSLQQIPGLDCGIAYDKAKKACCSPQSYEKLKKQMEKDSKLPGILDKAFSKAGVLGRVNKFTEIMNAINKMDEGVEPPKCLVGEPDDPNNPNCTCLTPEEMVSKPVAVSKILELCQKYLGKRSGGEINKCVECFANGGYLSAIGCLYFQPDRFILFNVFGLGLKLGGLFAFLCIIYSAIELQISQGNSEKIKKAQERITACIIGLLVVIFSVFILKIVGVNILGIPWLS